MIVVRVKESTLGVAGGWAGVACSTAEDMELSAASGWTGLLQVPSVPVEQIDQLLWIHAVGFGHLHQRRLRIGGLPNGLFQLQQLLALVHRERQGSVVVGVGCPRDLFFLLFLLLLCRRDEAADGGSSVGMVMPSHQAIGARQDAEAEDNLLE